MLSYLRPPAILGIALPAAMLKFASRHAEFFSKRQAAPGLLTLASRAGLFTARPRKRQGGRLLVPLDGASTPVFGLSRVDNSPRQAEDCCRKNVQRKPFEGGSGKDNRLTVSPNPDLTRSADFGSDSAEL